MQGAAASLLALLLGLGALPATAQTPVVEAKNADEAAVWQVNEDGALLGPGVFGTGVIPAEGAGTRLMWYPAKAAFRVGSVGFLSDGTEWDDANVGIYSVAFGRNTEASGDYATAMGLSTTASGSRSTAMGWNTTASGNHSTALGLSTTAIGDVSTAMGQGTTASGLVATAMGDRTTASGGASTAMGFLATASGTQSTAMGNRTTASGVFATAIGSQTTASGGTSTALGLGTTASGSRSTATGQDTEASGFASMAMGSNTTASGDFATAMGSGTTAQAYASIVIGRHNVIAGNPSGWSSPDPLLVAGNGLSSSSRANALTLRKDGNLTIAGNLTQNSDRRLKTDITPLGDVLAALDAIQPVRYRFTDETSRPAGPQLGLIAQEVERAFPELVTRGADGYLSVAYPKLTAVLVKGLQEQQDVIDAQQTQVEVQRQEIEVLRAENEATQERLAALEASVQDDGSVLAGWSGWGVAGLLALLMLGGLLIRRRSGTLAVMLVVGLMTTASAQAQTPVVEATNADETTVLQVNDDGGLLGLGAFDTGVIPAGGAGTRLMWHPAKAAFRAGRVGAFSDGTEWDDANVGAYSVAFGRDTEASGTAATATGQFTVASGVQSTAMGATTEASGQNATAMGVATTASGIRSTAMGNSTTASGERSVAMGSNTRASGNRSTAMGSAATASGFISTAMGDRTAASGSQSTAMGNSTTASGSSSTAMGFNTTAGGSGSLAAGNRAVVRAEDDGTFAWADSEFADFTSTGEDQFLVRAAGGVGLGTNAPISQLHVVEGINGIAAVGNHVAVVENNSSGTSNGPDVLALKTSETGPDGRTNFITFFDGNDAAVGAIEGNGSGGIVYKTTGGDFAEMLPRLHASETIAPGDVVGVSGGHITKATAGAEQVMVVTDRPALLGNAGKDNEGSHPVAFVGQVSVRVQGAVDIGDWIVPSGRNDGTAIAVAPEAMRLVDHAQVIGRAWDAAPGPGEHRVIVAVGLDRVGALVKKLQRQQAQIETLDARLTALEQSGSPMLARFAGPVGIVALLALVLLGGFVIRRRPSFKMPLALLVGAVGAAMVWGPAPVAAQTVSVQNGATLHIANGGVLDLHGSTLDFGTFGETAQLVESADGRVTGGLLTATRPLDTVSGGASGVDVAGLGLVFTSDQALDAVTVTRGHAVQQGGQNQSIQRYYDLALVPNGTAPTSLDLTLRYADAELGPLPEGELVLFRSTDDGTTWARRESSRDTTANTITLDGLPALSEAIGRWTLGAESQPLPVELTAFDAALDGDAVLLTWTTASETNNAGFEVQRWSSEDDWDVLAFVDGAGSTTDPQSYRHRIDKLDVGPHRFRLRQVDIDGTATYSAEVETLVQLGKAYRIGATYPNPVSDRASLPIVVREAQTVRAQLYDLLGRHVAVVHDGPVQGNRTTHLTIEGQDLPSGLYLLRVTGETFATTRRLMVVR